MVSGVPAADRLIVMKTYKAPWGKSLIWVSVFVTVLCGGMAVGLPWLVGGLVSPWVGASLWLPLLIPLGCLPFVVRDYTIAGDAILVRRLFWDTRLERGLLESAEVDPEAMRGSLRTFGNGGAYSFTGRYWSRKLGGYRALVTDPNRCVVLRFRSGTVVVSPADPQGFVRELAAK